MQSKAVLVHITELHLCSWAGVVLLVSSSCFNLSLIFCTVKQDVLVCSVVQLRIEITDKSFCYPNSAYISFHYVSKLLQKTGQAVSHAEKTNSTINVCVIWSF